MWTTLNEWYKLTGKTSGSSLHICRNLSGRADECSGPWEEKNTGLRNEGLKKKVKRNWVTFSGFIPFPPGREEAVARCHCIEPTWPPLSWWTGQWCTGLCYWSLQTGPPTGPVRWDWPWQSPAQNLHRGQRLCLRMSHRKDDTYCTFTLPLLVPLTVSSCRLTVRHLGLWVSSLKRSIPACMVFLMLVVQEVQSLLHCGLSGATFNNQTWHWNVCRKWWYFGMSFTDWPPGAYG